MSKTYIAKLEKQLAEEKDARSRMEMEVEELKRMNAEISSKLGLSAGGDWHKQHQQQQQNWKLFNYYIITYLSIPQQMTQSQ